MKFEVLDFCERFHKYNANFITSYYYPPDIGPGSLRAKSIVDALLEKDPPILKSM